MWKNKNKLFGDLEYILVQTDFGFRKHTDSPILAS
jgi:hypothetical protein